MSSTYTRTPGARVQLLEIPEAATRHRLAPRVDDSRSAASVDEPMSEFWDLVDEMRLPGTVNPRVRR